MPDKWNFVYIFMVLFGIASLTPFSAITTAIEYFNKSVSIVIVNVLNLVTWLSTWVYLSIRYEFSTDYHSADYNKILKHDPVVN